MLNNGNSMLYNGNSMLNNGNSMLNHGKTNGKLYQVQLDLLLDLNGQVSPQALVALLRSMAQGEDL